MKISVSTLAAAAFAASSPVSASEFNLRAAVNAMFSASDTKLTGYDARILVGGLTSGDLSEQELSLVAKETVAAYNQVFASSANKMGHVTATASSNVEADAMWWVGECKFCDEHQKKNWLHTCPLCCPYDDDDPRCPKATTTLKNDAQAAAYIHAQVELWSSDAAAVADMDVSELLETFEQDLCDRLRASSFSVFANAKECSFSFLAQDKQVIPVEAAYEIHDDWLRTCPLCCPYDDDDPRCPSANNDQIQVQVSLVGLKNNDMSHADAHLLNQVVVESHHEAFAKTGLVLASFQALTDIRADGHHSDWLRTCPLCCPYDDDDPRCPSASNDAVTLVMANVLATRAKDVADINAMDAKIAHADFETFVCAKLRASGHANFAQVHDCRFSFVFTQV